MMRCLKVVVALLSVTFLSTGCEDRVRETLGQRIEARAVEGHSEIEKLLAERDKSITEDLGTRVGYISKIQDARDRLTASLGRIPSDQEIATEISVSADKVKEFGGQDVKKHPLIEWRKGLVDPDVEKDLKGREKKYPGTFLEKLIPFHLTFLDTQDKYWTDASGLEEYSAYLKDYAVDAAPQGCQPDGGCPLGRRCVEEKCEVNPFYDDALFDWVFLHVQHLYDARRLPEDTRATSHLRYWQIGLGYETVSRQDFKTYIHRLCETFALKPMVEAVKKEKKEGNPSVIAKILKDEKGIAVSEDAVFAAMNLGGACGEEDAAVAFACLPLADEFREKAVMIPYYDQLLCRLKSLKEGSPDSPYMVAVDFMMSELERERNRYPLEKMVEYPVLPDTISIYAASQRLVLEMGAEGAFLGQGRDHFGDPTAGRIALAELEECEAFSLSKNYKTVRENYLTNLQTIRAEGDPALRQGLISIQAAADMPALNVLKMATATTSLDEEAYANTLNQEVWLAGRRRIDGRNTRRATQLQLLQGDARMNVKVGGELSGDCKVVGFTGDAPVDEMAPPVAAVIISGGELKAGPFDAERKGYSVAEVQGTMPTGELNYMALSDWASNQAGPIVLGIKGSDVKWGDLIAPLGPLSFKCTDPACQMAEFRTKPNIYVAACR